MSEVEAIRWKVCGMRDAGNIRDVSAVRPDYLGFIFYEKSPRFVGENFTMIEAGGEAKRVGVFVNESNQEMLSLRDRHNLDCLQLHGNETPEQVAELKKAGICIIKAFAVDEHFDFTFLNPYKELVDFFLFDTKGTYYGGNAKRFNWDLLQQYDQEVPFFLSGGLTVETICEVQNLRGMNLHALDLNSGLETAPAMKDLLKVAKAKELLEKLNESKNT